MYVKWIKLKNFRNYTDCEISFFPSLNLISGQNGQGKTNLVEGVMLNALTKSPRTSHDEDMKMENTATASSEICVSRNYGEVTLTCSIDNEKKKTFFINSNEVKKVSDVFGNLVAVYFSPDDLKIVTGSPDDRRSFMDNDISELSGSYYNLLNRYGKVLEQRNKLLKTIHNKSIIETQIDIWNEQLASLAGKIVRTRKSFIEKISEPAIKIISTLSKGKEKLEISYYGANGTTYPQTGYCRPEDTARYRRCDNNVYRSILQRSPPSSPAGSDNPDSLADRLPTAHPSHPTVTVDRSCP